MFCFQCQEALKNQGCTVNGVCGKKDSTAKLQDMLVYVCKGIADVLDNANKLNKEAAHYLFKAMFTTITNVNFDDEFILNIIKDGLRLKKLLIGKYGVNNLHEAGSWYSEDNNEIFKKAEEVGVLSIENEDIRSLRELLIYGLKGIAAYGDHALILGYEDDEIYKEFITLFASTLKDLSVEEMVANVLKAGELAVKVMALLDKANTETYGNPEITKVNIGVRNNPGILISGHDLRDMEMLLEQTKDTGIDVYTHGEMLPAHYYPTFKKYTHLVGNYGGSWWKQKEEFKKFNGPILMTTNCLVPPDDSYKDRVFTTGNVSYPGLKHINADENGKKDFSEIIEMAKKCSPPEELETGEIIGGFAHNQVLQLADKIVDAVKSGAIKRFIVMAGCDGRHNEREYFTDVAKKLPMDTVILTAGCAKYRYNKLDLGDIGGIPRVLDAGQCNDCYSLAVIALKLKEVFGLESLNDLPLSFDIAWYEQKAVTVLLALLYLNVKGIRLGPTLPAFLSPNVAKVLVEKFDIKQINGVDSDIEAMMQGK